MTIEIIVSSVMGVLGTVAASYIWERKIRDKIYTKRITSASNKNIQGLIELYIELFPDETIDYSADEIRELFDELSEPDGFRHVKADNILLIAKFKGAVVGFIFCHYYPERKKAIISYYGIDDKVLEAKKFAASALLKHLGRALIRKHIDCQYLFFDVAKPGQQLPQKENLRRKARIRLFMQSARIIGKKAYSFHFDYHSPKAYLSNDTHERPLVLMFIPIKGIISTTMPKSQIMSFLKFIFLDCYGDIYRIDDPRFDEYQLHLSKIVNEFESNLPEKIVLI